MEEKKTKTTAAALAPLPLPPPPSLLLTLPGPAIDCLIPYLSASYPPSSARYDHTAQDMASLSTSSIELHGQHSNKHQQMDLRWRGDKSRRFPNMAHRLLERLEHTLQLGGAQETK